MGKKSKVNRRKLDKRQSQRSAEEKQRQASRWKLLIACLTVLIIGGAVRLGFQTYFASRKTALQAECEVAKRQQDWVALEQSAREWASWEPECTEPWALAAAAARKMGQWQQAADYLHQIPDDAPLEAFLELSQIEMEALAHPLQSAAACRRAAQQYPEDSECHQRLLFVYSMTCQREQLLQEVHRGIESGAATPATYAYLMGAKWLTFTNGYDLNQFWLEAARDPELFEVAAAVHLVANRSLSEVVTQEATKTDSQSVESTEEAYSQMLSELRQKYPENMELLAADLNRSCLAGDMQRVAEGLNQADARTTEDNRFWRFQGWYYSAQENWQAAEDAYRQALQLFPYDWNSQFELAAVLRRTDRQDEAQKMQQRAVLGQKVMRDIMLSSSFDAVEAETYARLADYFEACGTPEMAASLRDRLPSIEASTAE